jgi:hypothetical protein
MKNTFNLKHMQLLQFPELQDKLQNLFMLWGTQEGSRGSFTADFIDDNFMSPSHSAQLWNSLNLYWKTMKITDT